MDSFLAARNVGSEGRVVGVEMTPEMLTRSRRTAQELGLTNVEFREGLAEELPIEDGWADVVIANGVLNLVADKRSAFAEIRRALRAGGVLQFADIATGVALPEEALRDLDLWTA
jgi:ubiquinone/menaquinone biosynthesis C-methylase UbiE